MGVRFDERICNKLKSWVEQPNTATAGELVRKIVTKEKVTFYTKDISMKETTDELIGIRKKHLTLSPQWLIDFVSDRHFQIVVAT